MSKVKLEIELGTDDGRLSLLLIVLDNAYDTAMISHANLLRDGHLANRLSRERMILLEQAGEAFSGAQHLDDLIDALKKAAREAGIPQDAEA